MKLAKYMILASTFALFIAFPIANIEKNELNSRQDDLLGVSRQEVLDRLGLWWDIPFVLDDEEDTLSDGRTRVFGSSLDDMVMLEFIGESSNLSDLSVTVELSDDLDTFAYNGLIMGELLALIFPEWGHSLGWLTASMDEALADVRRDLTSSHDVTTIRNGISVTYRLYEYISSIGLFISAGSPK